MQGTIHCFLGARSSSYTTHKALKRMLTLEAPTPSVNFDARDLLLPIKCQCHHFKSIATTRNTEKIMAHVRKARDA
jgi:hypothetical protein